MRIVVVPSQMQLEQVSTPSFKARLEQLGEVSWNEGNQEWAEDELRSNLQNAEVLLMSWKSPAVTEEIIKSATNLKFIGHAGGSIKKLIHPSAFQNNITVVNGTSVIAKSVAEYVLGIMISSLRNYQAYQDSVRNGNWRWEVSRGWENSLFNRTVGLIGFGEVSKQLITLLAPFNCKIFVYDPFLTEEVARSVRVHKVDLSELLSKADIVSVHCAVNNETRNLLNLEKLSLLKENALLINTSSGGVIAEDDLLSIVDRKKLRVYLDAFTQEPLPQDHKLRSHPSIYCTPHIAGGTANERASLMDYLVDQLEIFLDEPARVNSVNFADWNRLA